MEIFWFKKVVAGVFSHMIIDKRREGRLVTSHTALKTVNFKWTATNNLQFFSKPIDDILQDCIAIYYF